MSNRTALGAALVAVLMFGAGCTSTVSRPMPRKPTVEQQLVDIPVPQMFSFQPDESYVYEKSFRSCQMRYVGPGWLRPERVLEFYHSQMPNSKWSFVRAQGAQTKELLFFKGDEECLVRAVTDRDGEVTHLVIELRPRA